MIKKFLMFTLLTSGIFVFNSCRETVRESEVKEVEVEEANDEGVLERTGNEIDEEVNQEIDEEIDKIGDDN